MAFNLPDNAYRPAYRFEVVSLTPHKHQAFYVDANTLSIFRIDDLVEEGWAQTLDHGNQVIDTKKKAIGSNYFLQTDEQGRNIHTKYETSKQNWTFASNVKAQNDQWGSNDQHATTAHWSVIKAWDYYVSRFSRTGMSGAGSEVRVWASSSETQTAAYDRDKGSDYIFFNSAFTILDAGAHEFTHGVIESEVGGAATLETQTLEEGFCDVFGTMTEFYVEGSSTADWTIGEDGAFTRRSMINPTIYDHPDTYKGQFWDNPAFSGDLHHVNNGVFNKYFYLLAEGGYHNGVQLGGIGKTLAAKITYLTLVFPFQSSSNYQNIRSGSISMANLMGYIECSAVHNHVKNAWSAVGLGNKSNCILAGLENYHAGKTHLFPNPVQSIVQLQFAEQGQYTVDVLNITGELIATQTVSNSDRTSIGMEHLSAGTYLIRIKNKNRIETLRFVKQ